MSKASEWAKRLKEQLATVRSAQSCKPGAIYLVLSPNVRIEVRPDDDGNPRVKVGTGRDDEANVETDKLLAFCKQIQDTFGEATP